MTRGRQWEGLEDLLSRALSEAFLGSLQFLSQRASGQQLGQRVRDLQEQVRGMEESSRDLRERLSTEAALLRESQGEKAGLELEASRLTAEVHAKESELQALTEAKAVVARDRDDAADRFREKISSLSQTGERQLQELQASVAHARALESMVLSFAGDQRAHRETVGQWLEEHTVARGWALLLVRQAADGTLHGAEDVRGVLSAAGEAIRTASALEIQTYYAPGSSSAGVQGRGAPSDDDGDDDGGDGDGTVRKRREHWTRIRRDGDRATVLVVPNKCINMASRHDNACYLFVKPAEDSSTRFEESERAI